MASKLDKFTLKFLLFVGAKFKYLFNGKLYLGKELARNPAHGLPADMCLWLMSPYLKEGYKVTTDNYYISLHQAEQPKSENYHCRHHNKTTQRGP